MNLKLFMHLNFYSKVKIKYVYKQNMVRSLKSVESLGGKLLKDTLQEEIK